ncbi:MAG: hypothetical protein HIU81_11230 [Acidobacteria bacterium]|nr:hypothetical protein [Acidobacteriota bacterium]
MSYTAEKAAEYAKQDLLEVLSQYTAELMARTDFAENAHAGLTFDQWNTSDRDFPRVAKYLGQTRLLARHDLLLWPEKTQDVSWTVQGAGAYRGKTAAPELDWIKIFGTDVRAALLYITSCQVIGIPATIKWSFHK